LIIPAEKKEIIMTITRNRIGEIAGTIFNDIIKEKARDLNILLQYNFKVTILSIYTDMNSGPPEIKKTLTAETISEHFHRPLYSVCEMP
jgi:hypothetical protein